MVTYIVLRWVFLWVDSLLQPALRLATERFIGRPVTVPGAGLIAVIVLVYLLGLLAANVVGRYIIRAMQQVLLYVPVVNTVYRASKQFVDTLSGPTGGQDFRRVVMVEMPVEGIFAVGFYTGTTTDETGQQLALVYIPTSPMPNSGWVMVIPVVRLYETDLSVGEAMRLVLSGGSLAPPRISKTKMLKAPGPDAAPRLEPKGK